MRDIQVTIYNKNIFGGNVVESLLKLRCRNCNSIIELFEKEKEKSCNCGNCSIGFKDGRIYISSKKGVGDYILYNGDDEYIFILKKDLEGK